MEIRRLRYFLAVADAGNFTRAAERSFVAQSALSSQIARLEADVGNQLFVRSRSGVRLTAAGEALRPLAVRILGDVARAEEEMAAVRGLLAGRLRIGMIQGLPADLDLLASIAAFHREHQAVDLEVRTGASRDLADLVLTGGLDIAMVGLPASELPADLRLFPMVDDPLVGVFGAEDGRPVRRRAMGVRQLVDRGPFIHYRQRSGLRASVDAALGRAGVDPRSPFELDQIPDMVRLASLGVGVTIVPASAAAPFTHATVACTVVALADRRAIHHVGVVAPRNPSRPSLAFLENLPTL